jgi:hypothetical protein
MILFLDFRTVARLPSQLEGRLKEVHEQPQRRIQPRQGRSRLQSLVAPVADGAPDHGAVLLFDPGLVVLAVRTTAREHQARFLAIGFDGLVHEHAVVVRVEPEQCEWHPFPNLAQDFGQQLLLAHQQRRALRPARRDVRQRQCLHEAALRRRPAVRHQIRFDEPWRRIVPAVKGSHRNTAPDRGRWWRVTALSSTSRRPGLMQRPVDRGGAHRLQARANLRRQLKMAVPFHRLDQDRHQRPQPLAADPVRRFPDHDQRLADASLYKRRVQAEARTAGRAARRGADASRACDANRSPPRIRPGSVPVPSGCSPGVTSRQCNHQLVSCRHADLPHLRPHRCIPVGSKLNEATGRHPGAFQARQCDAGHRADELRLVRDRIERLVDAIAEGTPAAAVRDRLESLEARRLTLEAEVATSLAPAPRLHPALAEVYRQKVANLVAALEGDDAAEARELLRSLVDSITLHPEEKGQRVEVRGELAAILGLASCGAAIKAGGSTDVLAVQMKMVAGTGFEPVTFRL